ncbi:hypothetical protein PPACK8108_LOCUS23750 [Phakopsora pachyrhizi]|uniref:Uncharacterized protein n=1 Tax=Phakopsora pachyrhizi TaxID=170000 RepID=A0AAV0BQG0_PHAPC|nr:hypothetical protein PPACK8108_LOCUS23750 [Phakopsora pachyrhizi]
MTHKCGDPSWNRSGKEERQSQQQEGLNKNSTFSVYMEAIFENSDQRFPAGKDWVIIRRTIGSKKDEFSLNKKSIPKGEVMSPLDNTYYIVPQDQRAESMNTMNPSPHPFQANNPYLDNLDLFEEGQRLIISGEPLSKAHLAFEAACFLDSQRGEAWQMLGQTHAADERGQLAIKVFEKAVGCGGSDGRASWISLAICWVTKVQDVKAQTILEQWLRDAYPKLIPANSMQMANDPQNPLDG